MNQNNNWKVRLDIPLGGGFSEKFSFIPSDTKDRFKDNLNKFPDSPHLLNYQKNPINYSINNYGFRTPDDFFDGDEGTVYLGCSHTFGTGHHLENTWAYKLHNQIGDGKFINLSCGSIGLTSQYVYLKYFSEKLKIKKIFHYYPNECFFRYEFFNTNEELDFFNANSNNKELNSFYYKYLMSEAQNDLHNLSYLDAIKNVCRENNANYYIYNKSFIDLESTSDAYHKKLTPARDLIHLYVEHHDEICTHFLEQERTNKLEII